MNGRGFDLHTHSKASDGLLSPSALVKRADGHLAGLALTDHDSLAGLEEALAAGRELGLPIVPGVELTTDYDRYEVHILAYFIDHRHAEFRSRLDEVIRSRVGRAREMVARLAALGFPLPWEAVLAQAPGMFIGRPHIVRALVAAGLVQPDATDRFFQDYLVIGAPAYVPHQELTTAEAIRLALAAGGVPALAHPGRMGTEAALEELISLGLAGLEVYYPRHGAAEVARYLHLAEEFGLIPTGGSDFHGEPGGTLLGQAAAPLAAVETLARRAANPAGRVFLADLHIPKRARE